MKVFIAMTVLELADGSRATIPGAAFQNMAAVKKAMQEQAQMLSGLFHAELHAHDPRSGVNIPTGVTGKKLLQILGIKKVESQIAMVPIQSELHMVKNKVVLPDGSTVG